MYKHKISDDIYCCINIDMLVYRYYCLVLLTMITPTQLYEHCADYRTECVIHVSS